MKILIALGVTVLIGGSYLLSLHLESVRVSTRESNKAKYDQCASEVHDRYVSTQLIVDGLLKCAEKYPYLSN